MGDPRGFIKVQRETPKRRPVDVRILDWKEVYEPQSIEHLRTQASRDRKSTRLNSSHT